MKYKPGRLPKSLTPKKRLESCFTKGKNHECWIWKGRTDAKATKNQVGMGLFMVKGKRHRANRYVYEKLVGRIPRGKILINTCRTELCVNPRHWTPGTQQELIKDWSKRLQKRKCLQKVELSKEVALRIHERHTRTCWAGRYLARKRTTPKMLAERFLLSVPVVEAVLDTPVEIYAGL